MAVEEMKNTQNELKLHGKQAFMSKSITVTSIIISQWMRQDKNKY
jgi:hypothetical protein